MLEALATCTSSSFRIELKVASRRRLSEPDKSEADTSRTSVLPGPLNVSKVEPARPDSPLAWGAPREARAAMPFASDTHKLKSRVPCEYPHSLRCRSARA